jgi:hypothetical protein
MAQMNDFQNEPIHVVTEDEIIAERTHTNSWLAGGAAVLALAVGVMGGYMIHSHKYDQTDTARDAQVSSEVSQLQGQIDSLKSQLSQTASAPVAAVATQDELDAANAAAKRRAAADAKQFKSMQSSLSDQQKALSDTQSQVADTRSQVDQTRSDLQAGIDSTRTDLNGSIARTHDELVALEQKGERSYFEFDITQAKHFQKEGPLMVSLRKADVKHGKYDLAMVVNDNQLSKKNVNLYEPIWISGSDRGQVQLVVNKIEKDKIHGYVSAPKYSQSASLTPVSDRVGTAMGGENRNSGDQSINAAGKDVPAKNDPTGTPEAPKSQPQQEQ